MSRASKNILSKKEQDLSLTKIEDDWQVHTLLYKLAKYEAIDSLNQQGLQIEVILEKPSGIEDPYGKVTDTTKFLDANEALKSYKGTVQLGRGMRRSKIGRDRIIAQQIDEIAQAAKEGKVKTNVLVIRGIDHEKSLLSLLSPRFRNIANTTVTTVIEGEEPDTLSDNMLEMLARFETDSIPTEEEWLEMQKQLKDSLI